MLNRLVNHMKQLPSFPRQPELIKKWEQDLVARFHWAPLLDFKKKDISKGNVTDLQVRAFHREAELQNINLSPMSLKNDVACIDPLIDILISTYREINSEWNKRRVRKDGTQEPLLADGVLPLCIDFLPENEEFLKKLKSALNTLATLIGDDEVGFVVMLFSGAATAKLNKMKSKDQTKELEVVPNKRPAVAKQEDRETLQQVLNAMRVPKAYEFDVNKKSKLKMVTEYVTDTEQMNCLLWTQQLEDECENFKDILMNHIVNDIAKTPLYVDLFNTPKVRSVYDAMSEIVNAVSQPATTQLEKDIKKHAQANPNFTRAVKNYEKICDLQKHTNDKVLTPKERMEMFRREYVKPKNAIETVNNAIVDNAAVSFKQKVKDAFNSIGRSISSALSSISWYFSKAGKQQRLFAERVKKTEAARKKIQAKIG